LLFANICYFDELLLELKPRDKVIRSGIGVAKAIGVLALLYLFICSLDFLSSAFRLVGGRTTGDMIDMIKIPQTSMSTC
jgi:solute carrier family 34 (sodium-dependent phosphate cotransporter)